MSFSVFINDISSNLSSLNGYQLLCGSSEDCLNYVCAFNSLSKRIRIDKPVIFENCENSTQKMLFVIKRNQNIYKSEQISIKDCHDYHIINSVPIFSASQQKMCEISFLISNCTSPYTATEPKTINPSAILNQELLNLQTQKPRYYGKKPISTIDTFVDLKKHFENTNFNNISTQEFSSIAPQVISDEFEEPSTPPHQSDDQSDEDDKSFF